MKQKITFIALIIMVSVLTYAKKLPNDDNRLSQINVDDHFKTKFLIQSQGVAHKSKLAAWHGSQLNSASVIKSKLESLLTYSLDGNSQ